MKKFSLFFTLLFFPNLIFAQSSIVYEPGTTIEVTTGADICADNVTIQGTYSGSGTLCNGPLPVELSLFTATLSKNEINLYWKTETEVDNYGFNIERKISNGNWDSIAFIEGHGNSNSPKEYSYKDKDLFAGGSKFQYRLRQIDTDGQFEYSNFIEVDFNPSKFELFQNYPNPFNPVTKIRFHLPQQGLVKINVYNILGELVEQLLNNELSAGKHEVIFNGYNFASGVYIYSIDVQDSFLEVKKMVLLK